MGAPGALHASFGRTGEFDPSFYGDLVALNLTSGLKLCFDAGSLKSWPGNYAVRSQEFDDAAWTKTGGSVIANSTVAPDGTTTGDTFTGDGTSGNNVSRTITVVNGTRYTQSIYAKAGTSSTIVLAEGVTTGDRATFTLSGAGTAVVNQGAAAIASIQAVGNGWYRCRISNSIAGTNWGLRYDVDGYGTSSSNSLILWGAQLELGGSVGRYVATTAAGQQKFVDLTSGEYDFFRGADGASSTDDPTFNGTAGALTSSEYFSFDGGDYFRYDSASESWMNALHQNSALFTLLLWAYLPAAGTAAGLVGNISTSAGTGINWEYLGSGKIAFDVASAGNGNVLATKTADATTTASAWHLIGVVIDEATGAAGGFLYEDGAYKQVAVADTFDATYTTPAAGAASYTMEIFAKGNATGIMASGGRLAGAMMWQGVALNKAQIDTIWARQRARFGL